MGSGPECPFYDLRDRSLGGLHQLRVRESFRINQLQHSVPKQKLVVPIIEPMLQLIQVGVQMLHANMVVGADDRAFKQAPDALNAVRVNVATHPLFRAVIDALVASVASATPM